MKMVYITDMDNHRVQKFDSNSNFITKWSSEDDEGGQFNAQERAFNPLTGTVYITDTRNSRV
jgi:DNA-binding beta-propeller fold protein YncE